MQQSNTPLHAPAPQPPPLSLRRLISTSVITKLFVNTSIQIYGPFLPVFAAGLNTTPVVMGQLVSIRSAMGIFAPLFGSAADRDGYRRVIRLSLWISSLGSLIIGLSPNVLVALVGIVLSGLGAAGFVPTVQAYVSAQLPYNRRARGIGILEYAWALTGIFGLFLMGQLIAAAGWRAPFFVLAAGTFCMSFVFSRMPPAGIEHSERRVTSDEAGEASLAERAASFFRLDSNARSAYASITASSFFYFAAMQLMIVYGLWLQTDYGLGAAQLGTVALILGIFDLASSVTVSVITDRIGKRRSVALGLLAGIITCLMLPWISRSLASAVAGLALTRASFEFAIVSNLPLLSEQVPTQRGKVMTLGSAINLMGATAAGLTAPRLFEAFGIGVVSWTSAFFAGIALTVLVLFVREYGIDSGWDRLRRARTG